MQGIFRGVVKISVFIFKRIQLSTADNLLHWLAAYFFLVLQTLEMMMEIKVDDVM